MIGVTLNDQACRRCNALDPATLLTVWDGSAYCMDCVTDCFSENSVLVPKLSAITGKFPCSTGEVLFRAASTLFPCVAGVTLVTIATVAFAGGYHAFVTLIVGLAALVVCAAVIAVTTWILMEEISYRAPTVELSLGELTRFSVEHGQIRIPFEDCQLEVGCIHDATCVPKRSRPLLPRKEVMILTIRNDSTSREERIALGSDQAELALWFGLYQLSTKDPQALSVDAKPS